MTYKESIEFIYNNYGANIFNNCFRFYSIISDMIGQSIYDKRLAFVLFDIYKSINIYDLFLQNGLDLSRSKLEKMYKENYFNCTKLELIDAVNPISDLLYPTTHKSKNVTKCAVIKKANNKKAEVKKKKEKPVTFKQAVKNLNLNFISGSITINVMEGDLNYFDVDGKTIKNLEQYYDSDLNKFTFDCEYVRFFINYKNIKSISISGNANSIFLNDLNLINKQKLKEINIKTKNTKSFISYLDTYKITAKIDGNSSISGSIDYIDITTDNGDINMNLYPDNLSTMIVKAKSNSGKIVLSFNKKIKPKITSVFKKVNSVNQDVISDNCAIRLDLSTKYGYVKVH